MNYSFAIAAAALLLAACQPSGSGGKAALPGDAEDHQPFSRIAADETLHFTGTEPFWGGEARGRSLTYQTPENDAGTTVAIERFAGRGGLSLSGNLEGRAFDMMVTPGQCSDGMSDRTYPFVVTLRIGEETRQGCGWTDTDRFQGPEHP